MVLIGRQGAIGSRRGFLEDNTANHVALQQVDIAGQGLRILAGQVAIEGSDIAITGRKR